MHPVPWYRLYLMSLLVAVCSATTARPFELADLDSETYDKLTRFSPIPGNVSISRIKNNNTDITGHGFSILDYDVGFATQRALYSPQGAATFLLLTACLPTTPTVRLLFGTMAMNFLVRGADDAGKGSVSVLEKDCDDSWNMIQYGTENNATFVKVVGVTLRDPHSSAPFPVSNLSLCHIECDKKACRAFAYWLEDHLCLTAKDFHATERIAMTPELMRSSETVIVYIQESDEIPLEIHTCFTYEEEAEYLAGPLANFLFPAPPPTSPANLVELSPTTKTGQRESDGDGSRATMERTETSSSSTTTAYGILGEHASRISSFAGLPSSPGGLPTSISSSTSSASALTRLSSVLPPSEITKILFPSTVTGPISASPSPLSLSSAGGPTTTTPTARQTSASSPTSSRNIMCTFAANETMVGLGEEETYPRTPVPTREEDENETLPTTNDYKDMINRDWTTTTTNYGSEGPTTEDFKRQTFEISRIRILKDCQLVIGLDNSTVLYRQTEVEEGELIPEAAWLKCSCQPIPPIPASTESYKFTNVPETSEGKGFTSTTVTSTPTGFTSPIDVASTTSSSSTSTPLSTTSTSTTSSTTTTTSTARPTTSTTAGVRMAGFIVVAGKRFDIPADSSFDTLYSDSSEVFALSGKRGDDVWVTIYESCNAQLIVMANKGNGITKNFGYLEDLKPQKVDLGTSRGFYGVVGHCNK